MDEPCGVICVTDETGDTGHKERLQQQYGKFPLRLVASCTHKPKSGCYGEFKNHKQSRHDTQPSL